MSEITRYICDICKKETDDNELNSFKKISYWDKHMKRKPRKFDICNSCLSEIEERFCDCYDGAYEKGIQKCIDTIRDKYYHDGYDEDIVGVIVRILEEIRNDN